MEELLVNETGKLVKILTNLKKAPNRRYRRITLVGKLKLAKTRYDELLGLTEK